MSAEAPRPPTIDLLAPASYRGSQPHDQFAWLRANEPVHRHAEADGPGFWAITRYHDVQAIGRDAETFSSSPTIMIEDAPAGGQPRDAVHTMLLMADPPLHTRMRRLVSRSFTPRAAAALQPRLAELASRIVDEVIEHGRCDLVSQLAGEMPSLVIADVLGIPLEDGRALYRHTETLHSATAEVGAEAKRDAYREMFSYASRVFAEKRDRPAEDLAGLLANAGLEGRPHDEVDFFLWFLLLVDAGGDTTRNLVGAGVHALFRHPEQLARLQADPAGLLPTACEELLRWVSPVIYMRRTARRATEVAGVAIAEGDKVAVYYGSANRDPAVFDHPDRLDIGRRPNPHVAFGGGGPHFCLGAHLARLEITALLAEMLRRLHGLEPDGEASWMPSNFIFGPTELPVRFTPGRRAVPRH